MPYTIDEAVSRFQYLGYIFYPNKITIRQSSIQTFYKKLNKTFTKVKYLKNKDEMITNLIQQIEGVEYKGKKYSWLLTFKEITDYKILKQIDKFIEKRTKELKIEKNIPKLTNLITS